MESKSREQFETWYRLNWGHTEDNHESMFEISECHGCYYRLGVRMAYDAWQASRAAVIVELPDLCSCCHSEEELGLLDTCIEAVEAAGITVKGEGDEANANDS